MSHHESRGTFHVGHCVKAQQPLVSGAIRQIFAAESADEARTRLDEVTVVLGQSAPKVTRLLAEAEDAGRAQVLLGGVDAGGAGES